MKQPFIQIAGFDERFKVFFEGVKKISNAWYAVQFPGQAPGFKFETKPRYLKVIKTDREGRSASIYCFVDRTNGDIVKGSWAAPVKNGVRGNIFSDDYGLSKVDWHGTKYLRGGGGG